jgi:hypothetical protein
LARLRSWLLLTLVTGVLAAMAGADVPSSLFDTWGYPSDTETDAGNTITADTLSPPTALSAIEDGESQIDLAWTASLDGWSGGVNRYATGYDVFRRLFSGAYPATPTYSLTEAAVGCATDATCAYTDDTGLEAGTKYCYKVRTTYSIGATLVWTSGFTTEACAETDDDEEHTITLVPSTDKFVEQGEGNEWKAGLSDSECAAASTTCSVLIDEDIDTPNDSDFIRQDNGAGKLVRFELTNVPDCFVQSTVLTLRARALNLSGPENLTVSLFKANGTLVASFTMTPGSSASTGGTGALALVLSEADVNGLYVQVQETSAGGGNLDMRVTAINLDITYTGDDCGE